MVIKTLSELVSDIIEKIWSSNKLIDTKEGSVTRDVFIDPVAQELSEIYSSLDDLEKAQHINTSTGTDLDSIGDNFSLTRNAAEKASGYITFYREAIFTSDIVIPSGTVVATEGKYGQNPITFVTTEEEVMLSTSASTYYNYSHSRYETIIPIQAEIAGASGNIALNGITQMHSSVVDIDGVTNAIAITGGKDQESDSDFRERILLAITGATMGTVDGYNSLLYGQDIVTDTQTIASGDDLMTRDNGDGGSVDIYVRHTGTTEPHNQVFNFNSTSPNLVIFSVQPVVSISLVVAASFGALTEGLHYRFVRDTSGIGYSNSAEDSIQMLANDDLADGEEITVTYNWNKTIYILQRLIEQEDNKIVTADVLIKQGIEKKVDITCEIRIFSGYLFATVSSKVQTVISTYITSLKLGDDLRQGDIIHAIYSVEGVDDVIVPLTKLSLEGLTGVADIITIDNEYVSVGTLSVEEVA